MLLYSRGNCPIGLIKGFNHNLTLLADDNDIVTLILNRVFDAVRYNRYVLEELKDVLKNYWLLDEDEIITRNTIRYPHDFYFLTDTGKFSLVSVEPFIKEIEGNKIKIKNNWFKVNKVEINFSPVSYIVEILDWHIPENSFLPISKEYKQGIKRTFDFIHLEFPFKSWTRRLSILKGKLIDAIIKFLTLKDPEIFDTLLIQPEKPKIPETKITEYFIYTLDFHEPTAIIISKNKKLKEFDNLFNFIEWFAENDYRFDKSLKNKIKNKIKESKKCKMTLICDTYDYNKVREVIKDIIDSEKYLPFYKDINYDMETTIKNYVVKAGEYIPYDFSVFIKETKSLIDKLIEKGILDEKEFRKGE